jgi:hypothetical protein
MHHVRYMRKVLVPMAVRRERPGSAAPLNIARETYLRQLARGFC